MGLILVQWFFTVWVAGIPHVVGPFVNDVQCENMIDTYMVGGPEGGRTTPSYRPMCVRKEFVITSKQGAP